MNNQPWVCAGCGRQQEQRTAPLNPNPPKAWGTLPRTRTHTTFWDNSRWYRVILEQDKEPVYLCIGCFESKDYEHGSWDGAHETSVWQPGTWRDTDGRERFVWVLTA